MRLTKVLISAAAIALAGTVSAQAEPKIYAVESAANYCPAGMQPITLNGAICCGRPNQTMSYQQVMAHPVTRTHRPYRAARANCPVGTKGCTYD